MEKKSVSTTVEFNIAVQKKTSNQALVNTIVSQQNREHFEISFGGGQSEKFFRLQLSYRTAI